MKLRISVRKAAALVLLRSLCSDLAVPVLIIMIIKVILNNIGCREAVRRVSRKEELWEMHATETHNPVSHRAIWRTCPVAEL